MEVAARDSLLVTDDDFVKVLPFGSYRHEPHRAGPVNLKLVLHTARAPRPQERREVHGERQQVDEVVSPVDLVILAVVRQRFRQNAHTL